MSDEKAASEISSEEMKKIRKQIAKLQAKQKNIIEKCEHNYEILETYDYHDGWSIVACEEWETVHCLICGNRTMRKNGRINRYS